MKKEIWKDIPGYEGLYQVSSCGNVRSMNYRGLGKVKVLKTAEDKRGYTHVNLFKDKIPKTCQVHRLVAIAFIPNPNNLPQINHKDCNPRNNHIENLEWCDAKYNSQYIYGWHEPVRKQLYVQYLKEKQIKKKIYMAEYYRRKKCSNAD